MRDLLSELAKIVAPLSVPKEQEAVYATIEFFEEELERLPPAFQTVFIQMGRIARLKKVTCAQGYYEISYRRHGYCIVASDADLKTAKELFIKAANELEPQKTKKTAEAVEGGSE